MAFDKIFADFAVEPGSVTAQLMAADSVQTASIVDLSVTTAKIADLAILAGKIADGAVQTAMAAHIALATDAHDASAISVTAELQAALGAASADVAAALAALNSKVGGGSSDLTDHINDAEGAHAASAISYDPASSTLAATTVQAAIDEVESRVDSVENAVSNLQAKDWRMNPVISATEGQVEFLLDAGVAQNLPANLAAIIVTIAGQEQYNWTRNSDGRGITFDGAVLAGQKVRIRFYA